MKPKSDDDGDRSRVFIVAFVLNISITLEMKIKKKSQKRSIENSVEAPSLHSRATNTRSREVVIKHDTGGGEAEYKLNNLTVGDGALPRRSNSDNGEEVVRVHDDVDG